MNTTVVISVGLYRHMTTTTTTATNNNNNNNILATLYKNFTKCIKID